MYIPDSESIMRKRMMNSIDRILDQYVSDELVNKWVRAGEGIEIVKHIPKYVPKSAFSPEQIKFMETDPAWQVTFPDGEIQLEIDPYLS